MGFESGAADQYRKAAPYTPRIYHLGPPDVQFAAAVLFVLFLPMSHLIGFTSEDECPFAFACGSRSFESKKAGGRKIGRDQ